MKAIEIRGPGNLALVDLSRPEPAADEILVTVMASGICGTDLHIATGDYLGEYPIIPGHEFAGVVEEIGAGVESFEVGQRVAIEPNLSCGECDYCKQGRINHCRNWEAIGVTRPGGMAQHVTVPARAAFDIGELEYHQAAFMEPLSCIVHGFRKLNLGKADRVLIMGAGPIGNLFGQLFVARGMSSLTILEKQSQRLDLARSMLDADLVTDATEIEPESHDVIVDATGSTTLMEIAPDLVRKGGSILFFGVPPMSSRVELDAFEIFQKGLSLYTSYTSVRNSIEALDLLRDGVVDVDPLISHRLPLNKFQMGIDLMVQRDGKTNKVMIHPNS